MLNLSVVGIMLEYSVSGVGAEIVCVSIFDTLLQVSPSILLTWSSTTTASPLLSCLLQQADPKSLTVFVDINLDGLVKLGGFAPNVMLALRLARDSK